MSQDNTQNTVESTEQETVDTQEAVEKQEQKQERTFTREDIAKMINAERVKWETEREAKDNEAKKLAKMNADEKRDYEYKQREDALAQREAEIVRKELTAEARAMLSERDLPLELVNVVDLTNADTVKQSVSDIQKSFETAVQKAVEERIKGGAPIGKAQETVKLSPFEQAINRYKNINNKK